MRSKFSHMRHNPNHAYVAMSSPTPSRMHTRKAARSVILFLHCVGITSVQLAFILELDVYLWLAVEDDHTRLIVVFLIHQRFLDLLMDKRADLVEVSRGDVDVGSAIYAHCR